MNHARQSCASLQQLLAAALLIAAVGSANLVEAGGGPENVFLVVNSQSWASRSVANHFIHNRNLPASNVLYLDWLGPLDTVDIRTFREQILGPIFASIQHRRLDDHIDYVIYSSDLPWSVDARSEFANPKPPDVLNPVGSISGMTYFAGLILARSPAFLAFDANQYARSPQPKAGVPSTRAFRNWYGWGENGVLLEAGGAHYMLSTMLAVTSGRGNSVGEAIEYLRRSVEADGTRPRGTIYYTETEDVRTKTRKGSIDAAVASLESLGIRAQVGAWKVPPFKVDVQGLTMGAADFDWSSSHSQFRAGAIADNLTSLGGDLHVGASQVPLTEFLRFGAAGASGAVVEPYAVQAKFPLP
ncbi:MAG TPA: hypothetical protein VG713_14525, partial [Pirellulales bacterium]|nr:hypothetical protein [Pirellulales bacterium]